VLHGRDSGSVSAIEVRRDLDMLDQLSDIQEEHAILQVRETRECKGEIYRFHECGVLIGRSCAVRRNEIFT
jgi:hypothetical protein